MSSAPQTPLREADTESPVPGGRSRWVEKPRAAGHGTSASVTERSLLWRAILGQRRDKHLMGQLGDDAAQGREPTSCHWLIILLVEGCKTQASMLSTAPAGTYSSAAISRKTHSCGVRDEGASEGSGSCLSRSTVFALYL